MIHHPDLKGGWRGGIGSRKLAPGPGAGSWEGLVPGQPQDQGTGPGGVWSRASPRTRGQVRAGSVGPAAEEAARQAAIPTLRALMLRPGTRLENNTTRRLESFWSIYLICDICFGFASFLSSAALVCGSASICVFLYTI